MMTNFDVPMAHEKSRSFPSLEYLQVIDHQLRVHKKSPAVGFHQIQCPLIAFGGTQKSRAFVIQARPFRLRRAVPGHWSLVSYREYKNGILEALTWDKLVCARLSFNQDSSIEISCSSNVD